MSKPRLEGRKSASKSAVMGEAGSALSMAGAVPERRKLPNAGAISPGGVAEVMEPVPTAVPTTAGAVWS